MSILTVLNVCVILIETLGLKWLLLELGVVDGGLGSLSWLFLSLKVFLTFQSTVFKSYVYWLCVLLIILGFLLWDDRDVIDFCVTGL